MGIAGCRLSFVWMLIACGAPHAAFQEDEQPPRLPADIEEMLSWLPADSETLIVEQEPIELRARDRVDGEPFRFGEAASELAWGLLGIPMDAPIAGELAGLRLVAAMEGSRHFRAPRSLGMMPYEGCQILRFDEAAADELRARFQSILDRTEEAVTCVGRRAAVFRDQLASNEDLWTVFVAHPRADILLCATSRLYLDQVLRRMRGQNEQRAFPPELPEWQHVRTDAPVWAIRHYRRDQAAEDPSSPFHPHPSVGTADAQAVGFTFWYPYEPGDAEVRYLSENEDAVAFLEQDWHAPRDGLSAHIERMESGVVRISASVESEQAPGRFLFALLWYVGHGVFL